MTTTTSIRLNEAELDQLESVIALMPGASEASALKHLLLRGMDLQKLDLAVLLYTRDHLSTGEISERLGMSRLDVLHILEERRIRVLDIPVEPFERDLANDLP